MNELDENLIKDSFLGVLNYLSALGEDSKKALRVLTFIRHFKNQEFLIREGDVTQYANYLAEGVVRVFYADDRTEYNKTFFIKQSFPTPLTALLTREPCSLNFQALTHCVVLSFDFQAFRSLFDKHPDLERLMLRILEQEWIKKERHDIRMVTNDATTNYQIFREEYPGLEQLIAQYHIASYLGVTPIQLSRIRSKKIS